jgi:hypothetical protein
VLVVIIHRLAVDMKKKITQQKHQDAKSPFIPVRRPSSITRIRSCSCYRRKKKMRIA